MRVKIALTMGDPAGIGPEIAVRAAADRSIREQVDICLYGSPDVLRVAAERFAPDCEMPVIMKTSNLDFAEVPAGREDPACGVAARDSVIRAVEDTLAGRVDAVVTTPMNKASVNMAGISFTGHTELIAELCGVSDYAMMQSAGDLRVAFVTTHIPLREVADRICGERIIKVAEMLHQVIGREGITEPRLAVAAINPHAGEMGYMGTEDEEIVKPALAKLRENGMNIDGPFPPDTLFIEEVRSAYDGIIAMYHDQGHIPFKMLAFDRGVNSTLGLPIIRCSVDHGTAFPVAWCGKADTGSLFAAIRLAVKRVENSNSEFSQ